MNRMAAFLLILCSILNSSHSTSNSTCGRRTIPEPRSSSSSNNNNNSTTLLHRNRRIVKGSVSYSGQWPWAVSLKNPMLRALHQEKEPRYMNWSLVGQDAHICGGTLVSPRWIITAKHCLYYNLSPTKMTADMVISNWSAALGAYDINAPSNNTVTIEIDRVMPLYEYSVETYDFAMMHLSEEVNMTSFIMPACLPSQVEAIPGRVCYAVGWGTAHSLNNTLVNPLLKHATLTIMRSHESNACHSQTNKEICTSPTSGSVCRGDSGGPLVCEDPSSGDWILVGVTVRGSGCRKMTDRSIFTSVFHHMDFIENAISDRNSASRGPQLLFSLSVVLLAPLGF